MMPKPTKLAVVGPGPVKEQLTLAPGAIASDPMLYPAGKPPLNKGPTLVQLLTAEPTLLLAVLWAKFEELITVRLAAILLVAFCLELVLRLIKRGTANTARIPIKTNTTMSSTNVKPR